ncbi:hypothetical protein H0H87_005081 [Tephrocybe sp. NHM501043]|nr:hypothetical protein H0H87_005081 [Tephrocybe sp. NHM501043]
MSHDGERDTRGPSDFGPGAGAKVEDVDADIGEDEDVEEDEEGPISSGHGASKRRGDGLQVDVIFSPLLIRHPADLPLIN